MRAGSSPDQAPTRGQRASTSSTRRWSKLAEHPLWRRSHPGTACSPLAVDQRAPPTRPATQNQPHNGRERWRDPTELRQRLPESRSIAVH